VPGLYRIAYSFRSHAPNAPEGFWKGDVIAPAVCVLVKEQTP
jgi:hypothetical protein